MKRYVIQNATTKNFCTSPLNAELIMSDKIHYHEGTLSFAWVYDLDEALKMKQKMSSLYKYDYILLLVDHIGGEYVIASTSC